MLLAIRALDSIGHVKTSRLVALLLWSILTTTGCSLFGLPSKLHYDYRYHRPDTRHQRKRQTANKRTCKFNQSTQNVYCADGLFVTDYSQFNLLPGIDRGHIYLCMD